MHDGVRLEGGHRFPACVWDESRTFVVDKHRTPLPGCDQLLLTKGRRIQRRQIGQAARCDRQPASLFDNNSAVYLASNVCCLSFPYLQLHASRSILVPSARVCLACLPWVGRFDQSGGECHRRTPLLFSGRCLSRRVALERGSVFQSPSRARYPFVAVRAYGLVPPGNQRQGAGMRTPGQDGGRRRRRRLPCFLAGASSSK